MRIFILEDDIARRDAFEVCLSEHDLDIAIDAEAATRLFAPPYDVILLDHDLGGGVDTDGSNTGAAFAKWLMNNHKEDVMLSCVITHSYNPDGAKEICRIIPGCVHITFGKSLLKMLDELDESSHHNEVKAG